MSIMVQGIRIDRIAITRKDEALEFEGDFVLLTQGGTVIAKQAFNRYDSPVKLPMSKDLAKAMRVLSEALVADIEDMIGLNEGEDNVKGDN